MEDNETRQMPETLGERMGKARKERQQRKTNLVAIKLPLAWYTHTFPSIPRILVVGEPILSVPL